MPSSETVLSMRDMTIDLQSVARRYGRRWALMGVTLQVPPASVVMLAGRNGAGKSTLLRILATAIRPDRGTVTIGGFDAARDRQDVRKLTALLAHQSYLYESLTARENLAVVADHFQTSRERIEPLLDRVGLRPRGNDVVGTFSAGMRKRLALARLLLQAPRLALLDEPFGALDPPGFELVEAIVRELKHDGATVILATHQWERAARLADVGVVLDQGQLTWSGPAAEILTREPRWESR